MQNSSCTKAIVFLVISLLGTIAAFSSGASAIGMVLVLASIVSLGMGAGTIMNTPTPVHKD